MRPDTVVRQILAFNAGRDPARLALKYAAMRASPFTFLRGTAHLFYRFDTILAPFRRTPAVWSPGDLHLENFGSYKGDNRLVYFDLNDFDDAALGPAAWDLLRLLTSALIGAGGKRLDPAERRELAGELLHEYVRALATGKARWIERATAEGPIRRLLRQARRRGRRSLLADRTVRTGRRRRLRLDPARALPATPREHRTIAALGRRLGERAPEPRFYRVLDVARRVAGVASLGLTRFSVLVEGRGSPNNNYLLDLKGAAPSALAAASPYRQPRWQSEAERVVTVQGWVQAVSPALLGVVRLGDEAVLLRELQPTQDRLRSVDWASQGEARAHLARAIAGVTAWGHLRAAGRRGAAGIDALIEFAGDRSWRAPLLRAAQAAAAATGEQWAAWAAEYDRGLPPGGTALP